MLMSPPGERLPNLPLEFHPLCPPEGWREEPWLLQQGKGTMTLRLVGGWEGLSEGWRVGGVREEGHCRCTVHHTPLSAHLPSPHHVLASLASPPPSPSLPLPHVLLLPYLFPRPLLSHSLHPIPWLSSTLAIAPPLPCSSSPSSSAYTQVFVASRPVMPPPATPLLWTLVPLTTSAPTYRRTDPRTTTWTSPWGLPSPSSLIRMSELSTLINYSRWA